MWFPRNRAAVGDTVDLVPTVIQAVSWLVISIGSQRLTCLRCTLGIGAWRIACVKEVTRLVERVEPVRVNVGTDFLSSIALT